jgi:hypothetical protein
VLEAAKEKWGSLSGLHVASKAIDVRPGHAGEHLVIGCIYKEQALKPSILDEYSDERRTDIKPAPRLNYCSDGDTMVLEDESGRMPLSPGALPLLVGNAGDKSQISVSAMTAFQGKSSQRPPVEPKLGLDLLAALLPVS